MKKIIFFLAAVLFGFAADAQIMLTQSVDPENITDGGVACWDNESYEYRNNSFWRSYDLADFSITGDFEISEVQWGQGAADANNVLTLNIYVVDSEDLFLATEYDLIASTTHNSDPANYLSLVSEALTATIPVGSIIAFKVNPPDGGAATDVRFLPGYNTAGENAPCYLQSADVGGFPDSYVMNIMGEEVPLSIGDNLSEYIAVYPTPVVDVLNVKVPSYIQVTGVSLYDILGKNTGVSYSNGSMDVSNLSRGVYLLIVETNEGTLTQKIVKK